MSFFQKFEVGYISKVVQCGIPKGVNIMYFHPKSHQVLTIARYCKLRKNAKDIGRKKLLIFIEHNYEKRNKVGFIFIIMLLTFEGCHH